MRRRRCSRWAPPSPLRTLSARRQPSTPASALTPQTSPILASGPTSPPRPTRARSMRNTRGCQTGGIPTRRAQPRLHNRCPRRISPGTRRGIHRQRRRRRAPLSPTRSRAADHRSRYTLIGTTPARAALSTKDSPAAYPAGECSTSPLQTAGASHQAAPAVSFHAREPRAVRCWYAHDEHEPRGTDSPQDAHPVKNRVFDIRSGRVSLEPRRSRGGSSSSAEPPVCMVTLSELRRESDRWFLINPKLSRTRSRLLVSDLNSEAGRYAQFALAPRPTRSQFQSRVAASLLSLLGWRAERLATLISADREA